MLADKGTHKNFSEYVPRVEAKGTGLIQLAMWNIQRKMRVSYRCPSQVGDWDMIENCHGGPGHAKSRSLHRVQ